MVDVVTNHFGAPGPAESVDYTQFNPFNSPSYFHPICFINDYSNQTQVEVCDIGTDAYPLPDVNTTQAGVRTAWQNWIQYMVSTYSIDGIRIDSVKNVEKDFWQPFNKAAGVYAVGEVSDGNVDYVCPYTSVLDGVLDYPSYWQATNFFSNPSATSANFVGEFNYMKQECKDMTTLGPFSENHDQARFASHTSDLVLAKNIMAWTLLADGVPILYQGQEQHLNGSADPYDREAIWLTGYNTSAPLYKFATQMNAIRKLAIAKSSDYVTTPSTIVYSDDHNVAFRKGDSSYMILNVLNNLGSSAQTYTVNLPNVGFPAGLTVVDVLSCRQVVVGSDGSLNAYFTGGLPMVYYPQYLLSGSGWCGY
ncbi:glycoside hydrolase family 13 protein [Xylona heveae TC161]|uniref:alpha-amylase n=1 Tax=Xylona heveae (strain CBS 132557 / TC161) TaxID=1328760 RepID=A0A165G2D3_XYLHT|nr:glycoside hydrolase family 13 protein [Xylona heveae TC161]KZF21659.1 glycoside hydrolase family 13 protein [Xylona heveae TC161]